MVIWHVALSLLFILCFLGWGNTVLFLFRMRFHNIYEQFFISSVTGVSLYIVYIILLSLFGAVNEISTLLFLVGAFGVILYKVNRKDLLSLVIMFLLFLPIVFLTLYPPSRWDDMSFHLPIAKSILEHGKFAVNEYLRYPFFPMNGEIPFTLGLQFNEISAQLISFVSLLLIAIGCYGYSFRLCNSKIAAIIASVLLCSNWILIRLGTISYIDINLSLFVFTSVIALLIYIEENDKKWLYLSSVFLGVAVGIKYSALIFCFILGFVLLFKKKWLDLLKYGCIVFITGIPWYLRNIYFTKNPVWPFMSSVFGKGEFWSSADYSGQFLDFSVNGVEKSVMNFLKIPYYTSGFSGEYAVNILVWVGLILFLILYYKKKSYLTLLYIFSSYTLFWFLSVNLVRYYTPIVPVLSVISGLGFYYLFKKCSHKSIQAALVVIFIVINLFSMYQPVYDKVKKDKLPPITAEQKNEYLTKKLPAYQATIFAKELEGITYGLYNENLYYYGEGKIIGDWFGPARYSDLLEKIYNSNDLSNHLENLGVSNILFNKTRMNMSIPDSVSSSENFRLVYDDDNAAVYTLVK